MPAKVYTDKDANISVLKNKTLAVLGFDSQRHAHALNLKESGCKVIIGLYEGSKSIPVAREKGFKVVSTAEAVKLADVIFVALPDTKQAAVYKKDIAPNLTKGKTLLFSHGFAIHFKTVKPRRRESAVGPAHSKNVVTASPRCVPSTARKGCKSALTFQAGRLAS